MLGICVVYLAPEADPESDWLLDMNLRQLAATTEGPYRVYGVALRLSEAQAQRLRAAGVVLPAIAPHQPADYEGNRPSAGEHSHYLDQLVDAAFDDGCSCVATFDMDSWPISKRWDRHYRRFLGPEIPLVAMQRLETGDHFPNPAFSLIDRSLWRRGETSFAYFNPRGPHADPGVVARAHSGTGLLAELRKRDKAFLPLLRTNQWNPHPVMCGIYDHRIFHLGAGSREPRFNTDKQEYDMIDTDLSRNYAGAANRAKRSFFIGCLKSAAPAFLAQLMRGEQYAPPPEAPKA